MFEQALLQTPTGRRPWTFFAATSLEILALAVVLLVPLFYIAPLSPPSPPPAIRFSVSLPHVELVPVGKLTPQRSLQRIFTPQAFTAPRTIPKGVPAIHEAAPDIGFAGISEPGALSSSSLPGVIGISGTDGAAPPPPIEVKQPKPEPQAPMRVGGKVQEAKIIKRVLPKYPEIAIRTRMFGKVHLIATIGKDGTVKTLKIIDGPAFLVSAAVEAVKQWTYKPTLLNGEPVEVIAPVEINFILSQ